MNFSRKELDTVTLAITPEIAHEMLGHNIKNNRNLKAGWVKALADNMERGTFMLTSQGIAFDKDGNLIDGQHRLHAVIKSGCTVPMRVTFGCDSRTVGVIDAGSKRTAKDVAKMYHGDTPYLHHSQVIGAFSSILRQRNSTLAKSLTPNDLSDLTAVNANSARMLYGSTITRKMTYATVDMRGALLEATMLTGDAQAMFDFRNVYELNEINTTRDYCNQVVFALKQRLTDSKIKRVRINSHMLYNLTQNAFYAFINNKGRVLLKNTSEDRYIANVQKLMCGTYDSIFANLEVTANGIIRKNE